MPYGIDTIWLVVGAAALLIGVLFTVAIALLVRNWRNRREPHVRSATSDGRRDPIEADHGVGSGGAETHPETEVDEVATVGNYDAVAAESHLDPDIVEMRPPNLKGARLGMFGEMIGLWRRIRKRKKMAKKGYMQWYLIDETFPSPKFVKPELKGGGVPELKYKGIRYLFPRSARLPAEQQGLWTYVHEQGQAEPIKLTDPLEYTVDGDELQEYLTKRVTSSPPGWLDRLDLDFSPQQIMAAGIIVIVLFAFFTNFMGG